MLDVYSYTYILISTNSDHEDASADLIAANQPNPKRGRRRDEDESMADEERKATGSFTYKAKTKTGYSLNMTGKVFGPKHGTVIVAALDSQLCDDVDLLHAAPDLISAFTPIAKTLGYAEWASPEGAEQILKGLIDDLYGPADAAIAKATASKATQAA